MFAPVFLTMIFLHVAFGLASAFVIFYLARNTEGLLKLYGNITAWFLITTSVFAMIFSLIHVAKQPDFSRPPCFMYEKMKASELQEEQTGEPEETVEEEEITGSACPVIMNDD